MCAFEFGTMPDCEWNLVALLDNNHTIIDTGVDFECEAWCGRHVAADTINT